MMLLVALSVMGRFDDSTIGGPQFVRLIQGAHADFRNVSFVFEGDFRFVGPEELLTNPNSKTDESFQGNLAWREDGSVLVDTYIRAADITTPLRRSTAAVLKDRLERQFRTADQKAQQPEVRKGFGVEGLVQDAQSAFMISYSYYFSRLADIEKLRYEFLGWKTIEGHRCLCVQIDRIHDFPGPGGPKRRFWIDLERGGHPLRVEYYDGEQLAVRVNIQLSQVELPDGRTSWFPNSGTSETYRWKTEYKNSPIFAATYLIVPGTIRFDRDLPDSVFSVAGADRLQDTAEMQKTAAEFAHTPPRPVPKTDRASVQEHLDKTLAKADAQAKQLEASSPARQVWGWTPVLQTGLGIVGVLLIGGGLYWRFRH